MRNKEEILKEIEEIKERLNDITLDFIDSYDITRTSYIEDYMSEYADSMVSIYYSDIEKYYKSHIQESSDALKEFGYTLDDFDTLEDACMKGAQVAEYSEYYSELLSDLEDVEELKELYEELEEIEEMGGVKMLDKQIWEIENNIEFKEELDARYDSRKSFYKKAYVVYCKNGDLALQSYSTIVAVLKQNGEFESGKYSQTTNRHIKEFKRQFVD